MNPPRCPECQEPASRWSLELPGLDHSLVARPGGHHRKDASIFECAHGHRWGSRGEWDEHLSAISELADLLMVDRQLLGDLLPAPVRSQPRPSSNTFWDDDLPNGALDPSKHWFIAGGSPLVVVGIDDAHHVEVASPKVTWLGQFPCLGAEPGSVHLAGRDGDLGEWMRREVAQVVARRLALFERCAECQRVIPIEWMHNRVYCQGCAQQNHGVVY